VLFFLLMRSAQEPAAQSARTSLFSQSKGADGFAFAARRSGSLLTRRRACESSPKARFPCFPFTSFEVLFSIEPKLFPKTPLAFPHLRRKDILLSQRIPRRECSFRCRR